MTKKKNGSWFMEAFDVLFVMILCFATLLTTMLMQGAVLVGGSASGMHYSFNIASFLMVVAGLIIYMVYIIPHSDKELRKMVNHIFGEKENKKEEAKL
ncbi:hypothetical protein [Dehalobacterium formicoaceticum]|uniref:Uncharacterized protein n=1 Tax=Dehalobacterium formicoaceticum TaxID=51515 RepID=A0ABT1Y318_9FIRM|nr:hypothetical protein [Dehalobacterium formicoaceticum]MCR6544555.1 hypothetical protein [Dehalobacterium formicoaceticum]